MMLYVTHVPGAGFICFPLMLIWVVVSMDLHVAQFFFPHGFVCPCLLPKAMLLVLTNRLRRPFNKLEEVIIS